MNDLEKKDFVYKQILTCIEKFIGDDSYKPGHIFAALSEVLCLLIVESEISEKLFIKMMEVGYIKAMETKKRMDAQDGT